MSFLKTVKDKLYNKLVFSNEYVRKDYQGKILYDPESHNKHRIMSWIRLIKLNIKYRIFKKPYTQNWESLITQKQVNNTKVNNQFQNNKKGNKPPVASISNPLVYIGAESLIERKEKPEHFIKKLLSYDVISFDIFDTLIFRPVSKPRDIFCILNTFHNTIGFEHIRIKSEIEARQIRKEQFGDSEITLEDIYKRVELYTDIPFKYGMEKEIEIEKKLLFPNPYMKKVFDMLKINGKKIIAVSDMYLSKDILKDILENCGYNGFEEIFVSCDCKCDKKDGLLFNYVKENLNFNEIVHIDDNWSAILSARKNEWNAIHYKNVNNVGICHRTPNLSPIIGSAYSGIVNQHLYSGFATYSPIYEFGFTYGGFFALGYCSWIHDYCKNNHIDKILFLSRDGHILKQVYDKMYNDIENEYFYFSRIAGARISVKSWFYIFLDSFVIKKVKSTKMPISFYMELLEITSLNHNLEKYGLSTTDILIESNKSIYDNFIEFLTDHKDEIYSIYNSEVCAAKKYIESKINGYKKVAIIDIGWRGSSALAIKRFIQHECDIKCEVIGLMAASPYDVNAMQMIDGSMAAYMFSLNHNYNALSKHERFKADNAIYEIFLTACHPTLKRFYIDNNIIKFEFESPDVENYTIIEEIHQGMLDFVDKYIESWKDFDFMFKIPGNDVVMNIQHLVIHKEYFKKYFQDFKYNMGVGGETISFPDILK